MVTEQLEKKVKQLHQNAPLVDVHAHPSLKCWLFDRDVRNEKHSTGFLNPFSDRSSIPKLRKGGVRVQWVTHYVPEQGLLEDFFVRLAARLLGMKSKLQQGTPYDRLSGMMTRFTEQVESDTSNGRVATSLDELEENLGDEGVVFLHAIEGGHVLENNLDYVEELAGRGVVSLTLTHFFPNGIARHVDAIPDSYLLKSLCSFQLFEGQQDDLTGFGRDLLDRMVEHSVLPDITHTAPSARRAVYDHVPGSFPLVATHVGLRTFCPDPMNLSDEEIRELADRNGAVGLIFFNYYLNRDRSVDLLESLWKSIEHIHDLTGSWDHIMIGTDFDGFTRPATELKDASKIGEFTKMLLQRGVPETGIKKILGGNAMRIVRSIWSDRAAEE